MSGKSSAAPARTYRDQARMLPHKKFIDTMKAEGIDPSVDFRYEDMSELSFAYQSLDECDFTGAILRGCDFYKAKIQGACFDHSVLGNYREQLADQAELAWAEDWLIHCDQWSRDEDLSSDRHIDELECFQDAPFSPKLTMLPTGAHAEGDLVWGRAVRLSDRIAVASMPVTALNLIPYGRHLSRLGKLPPFLADKMKRWYRALDGEGVAELGQEVVPITWSDSEQYLEWLREMTGRNYRRVAEPVWEVAARRKIIVPTAGVGFEWMEDHSLDTIAVAESDGSPNLTGDGSLRVGRDFGNELSAETRTFLDSRRSDHRGKLRVQRAWAPW